MVVKIDFKYFSDGCSDGYNTFMVLNFIVVN